MANSSPTPIQLAVSAIEDAIAAGQMDAPQVFTKMRELLSIRSESRLPDIANLTDAELAELDFQVSNEIARRATAI